MMTAAFGRFAAVALAISAVAGVGAQDITGFTVLKLKGRCTIRTTEPTFKPMEKGKTYPFGATVKTGRNSSVTMQFSDGNTFLLLARTKLALEEDTANPKLKVLKLEQGELSLKLDKFPKDHKLQVETPTAICGAIGTRFAVSFDDKMEDNQVAGSGASRFSCDEGEIEIASSFEVGGDEVVGRSFSVPSMTAGGEIVAVIHEGLENSYSDITVNRGRLSVTYGGSDENTIDIQPSGDGATRFTCSLEKSAGEVDMVALQVENGSIQRQVTKGLLKKKTSFEPLADAGGTVMIKDGKVYADNDEKIIGGYIAAARTEGELHAQVRAMRRAGVPEGEIVKVEAKLTDAAAAATAKRRELLSKRTRKMLRAIRSGARRRIRR
jgi:hypothetical protein